MLKEKLFGNNYPGDVQDSICAFSGLIRGSFGSLNFWKMILYPLKISFQNLNELIIKF